MSRLDGHALRAGCLRPGAVFGVPVFLHWSAPVMLLLVGFGAPTRALGLALVWLVHGLGHVWALRGLGAKPEGIRFNGLGGECGWGTTLGHSGLEVVAWSGVAAQSVLLMVWAALRIATGFFGGALWIGLDEALLVGNAALIVLNLLPLTGLDGDDAWTLLGGPRIEDLPSSNRPRPDPEAARRRAETEKVFQKMLDELMRPAPAERGDDDDE